MLRNHMMTHMGSFANYDVGALINGVMVPVSNVFESADPPGIALVLDPDQLTRALKAGSPVGDTDKPDPGE